MFASLLGALQGAQHSSDVTFTSTLHAASDADRVANALYPHGPPMFSRGRWINSLEPVKEVALLMNVHGIFRRSVPIWLNKMKGKGCILLPVVRTADESRAVMNWEISSEGSLRTASKMPTIRSPAQLKTMRSSSELPSSLH